MVFEVSKEFPRSTNRLPVTTTNGPNTESIQLELFPPAQISRHAHPTIKLVPPIGVIAPNHRTFVTANRYSEPEKITMPIRKQIHATFAKPNEAGRVARMNNINA